MATLKSSDASFALFMARAVGLTLTAEHEGRVRATGDRRMIRALAPIIRRDKDALLDLLQKRRTANGRD